jgi:hypothetical protein
MAISRTGADELSSGTELVIFFVVLAAGWIAHVVRQVMRDRRKPSLPGTADAYEGNLVSPAAGARRHGIVKGLISKGDGGVGHEGSHHGPGGFDGHGPFGGIGSGHH